jgi:hypothetical protein
MNKEEASSAFLGAIFTATIGSVVLQALGALILGIIGALGGWLFAHFAKPRLEKLFKK